MPYSQTKKSSVVAELSKPDSRADHSTADRASREFSRNAALDAFYALELERPAGTSARDWAPVQRTRQIGLVMICAAASHYGLTKIGRRPFRPGCIWLSVESIAQRCETLPRLVQQSLHVLEKCGVIHAPERAVGRGMSIMWHMRIGWKARAKPSAEQHTIAQLRAELERVKAELDKRAPAPEAPKVAAVAAEPPANATRWHKRLIVKAYAKARQERYGVAHVDDAKRELEQYALFIERLSVDLVTDCGELATEVVAIYLNQPGKDARLCEQKHPLPWMVYDLPNIEEELRRRRHSKQKRERRAITVEPCMSAEATKAAAAKAARFGKQSAA